MCKQLWIFGETGKKEWKTVIRHMIITRVHRWIRTLDARAVFFLHLEDGATHNTHTQTHRHRRWTEESNPFIKAATSSNVNNRMRACVCPRRAQNVICFLLEHSRPAESQLARASRTTNVSIRSNIYYKFTLSWILCASGHNVGVHYYFFCRIVCLFRYWNLLFFILFRFDAYSRTCITVCCLSGWNVCAAKWHARWIGQALLLRLAAVRWSRTTAAREKLAKWSLRGDLFTFFFV